MLLNTTTGISTSKVLLVPYSKWHVPQYHEWMKDEEIQLLTASEPLTLKEEYGMQESWRNDADKLTFIICHPTQNPYPYDDNAQVSLSEEDDSATRMIGDINLFLKIDDGEEGTLEPVVIGEIELMIAEKNDRGRGFGRAALLAFLRYVIAHEGEVVGEFVGKDEMAVNVKKKALALDAEVGEGEGEKELKIAALSVKVGQSNERSLALFESVGFRRVTEEANYFGEWELRKMDLGIGGVEGELEGSGVKGYREVTYFRLSPTSFASVVDQNTFYMTASSQFEKRITHLMRAEGLTPWTGMLTSFLPPRKIAHK
ncbi:GNAT domain-containing protein [Aspergillus cavernicola]|uniref:GNAT domain-containing protein n=1 Tax=Aspergillus cavernicola TaxID=176166 RepID=A0ABR4HJL3_9EURO